MTEISLTCKTIGSNVRGKSDTRIGRDSSCAKQNNNIQQNKNENTRFSMTCGVICANVCRAFYDSSKSDSHSTLGLVLMW